VATPVDFAELSTQLATKAVNGQENPVDTIFANKFFETQSHLMLTGHIKGAELVVFNDAAWKKLSPTLQGQIMEAANEVSKKASQMTQESDASYTKQLADKGMKVIGPKEGLDINASRPACRARYRSGSTPSSGRCTRTSGPSSNRLLKKAHLQRWHARALAAAYLKYALTHLRWVPRPSRSASHLDLFEQPAEG